LSLVDVTGAQLKAARGKEHLAELQAHVSRWLADVEVPGFTVEATDGGRTHIVRVVGVPSVPVAWPLELGDALHNLRSALDFLAWQAVLANGGTPGKGTSSPVLRERKERSVTAALSGASPKLVEVRTIQPYNRCRTAESLRSDLLWTLHRLNIEDKITCWSCLRSW